MARQQRFASKTSENLVDMRKVQTSQGNSPDHFFRWGFLAYFYRGRDAESRLNNQ
jgi:hypothetical protein